ncbi:YybH family protein [Cohnella caldifontis]|uniref:YybH family protein n=1 Tax=Cohnella caldifontis TaxID=3027471 RepID=UPI0023EB18F1|nr:nuclear transport factor 2 family protein [Cohnella sp. YIM B05605]
MRFALENVHDVIENYKSAILERDVEKFTAAFAPDIHAYDCWEDWEIVGQSDWRRMVEGWFGGLAEEGVTLKTDFHDVAVEEDSNVAFVRCAVTFAAYNPSGEKLRQMTNRFTMGLRKDGGSWSIAHQHSSLPISMETGKGLFNLR